ncbi:MAG: hypothetical protein JO100_00335 [Pseudonocardia sp.]|nr:hypothetical protein [Pseudonocardia sp.]
MANTPALLALRALGLGDFLAAVPALRALHAAFPNHQLTLATPTWLHPLCGATRSPIIRTSRCSHFG